MASSVHMVLPDLHIPFHDPWLLRNFVRQVKALQPSVIHMIGDAIDCYGLSKFDKNPLRKHSLQDEVDELKAILRRILQAAPSVAIHYSEGNHEARITKLLWGACKAFAGIKGLSIPELLGLEEMGITWHPWNSPYHFGHLWFTHGDILRAHAGCTARAVSDKCGHSVVVGHSHRMGCVPRTFWGNQQIAWECGHMMDVSKAEYLTNPNWQAGWLVIDYITPNLWDINPVRMVQDSKGDSYLLHKGEQL